MRLARNAMQQQLLVRRQWIDGTGSKPVLPIDQNGLVVEQGELDSSTLIHLPWVNIQVLRKQSLGNDKPLGLFRK